MLGEIIHHIRFLSITVKEFESGPALSGILTDEECLAVSANKVRDMPAHLSTNRQPRLIYTRSKNELYFLRQIENPTVTLVESLTEYVTTFTVNQNVVIRGIFIAETDSSIR